MYIISGISLQDLDVNLTLIFKPIYPSDADDVIINNGRVPRGKEIQLHVITSGN